ncbi:MAG: TolC family protein [Chryseobacterium sp.]|uniref:TolC family protein n=1 Tax=Chryseobacterium sp. TaxID=1871047 RepID=UPI0025C3C377|nr:TolC family protein [Chryseobacterium sp.]MCJ7932739.1 TolC family protein [Chryseobacterium sp.]
MERKFLFLIFSCIAFEIFTQNPSYPVSWTLENCIEYAKENNISINSLRFSKNAAEQDLLQAKEPQYPNLNGTISRGLLALHGSNGLQLNSAQSQSIGLNSSMTLTAA